ncbi:hypothetical protein EUTSA_v10000442mg, partial [Eutrema salsugineum]
EARSVASVMRFQFHDCFANLSLSNIGSLRSFDVIDNIKEALEKACPATVPCADIIIMSARDAVALTGGPDWEVKLGRKDSLTASQKDSDDIMPSPRSNATSLINLFQRFNLSTKDMVALSGSHSIGEARCFSIMARLYNQSGSGKPDPAFEPIYREKLSMLCPMGGDENVTSGRTQLLKRGFLNSDQTLFTSPETSDYVTMFSENETEFLKAFAEGMVKMGDLQSTKPVEIRLNCRVVNRKNS